MGDIACDHYHLWEQDLALLKEIGVDSYRFSISWPRVFPDGKGKVNPKGLAFYKNIAERLKEYGISAAVTLNHWDLPQKLQDLGGWANRDTAKYFQDYAETMFEALGESASLWITHNEPYVVAFLGNAAGRSAHGHKDVSEALSVSHNMLLAHGLAVQAYRRTGLKGKSE